MKKIIALLLVVAMMTCMFCACAKKEPAAVTEKPGTVLCDKHGLKVACTDGYLQVSSLQMAGKKRMAIKDFLCGFKPLDNCMCN